MAARRLEGEDHDAVIDHLHGAVALEDAEPSLLVAEGAIDRDARVGAILARARSTPPTLRAHRKAILEARSSARTPPLAPQPSSSAPASTGPSSCCSLAKNAARDGEVHAERALAPPPREARTPSDSASLQIVRP